MIRVVAVDLDGTLLRSDGTVSPRTVAALRRADRAGARIVICTARPPREIGEIAAAAGVGGTAVCANGAVTYDLATGAIAIVGPLPLDLAERVAAVLGPALDGVGFAVETGRRALIAPGFDHVSSRSIVRVAVASVSALWAEAESCVKLLAWSPAPVTGELIARLQALVPEVTVTWSGGKGMLEISAATVSKADTLTRLCAGWDVPADQVIAFGDMPNDVPMLRWAGVGVAVANAQTQALAAADRVTASNDDDGVAVVLEELFPGGSGVVPAR
ncbi:haloacid dehalogenase [Catellatospora methionotrophica]|uniref:Haloacid dehalogenase n=1 Tax=Catellatospora methionotrophica TaxID=121620 RepID=A0A8J3PFP4_9ACTN|nr:HAD family hydrolase [Catellatospora methionotrophica]GIG15437.1 haloacid dehalogenase [Catellatospora methionotrophica]